MFTNGPVTQVELPPQPFYQLAIALAGAGALENAYLTFNKLAGVKPALCAAGEAGRSVADAPLAAPTTFAGASGR